MSKKKIFLKNKKLNTKKKKKKKKKKNNIYKNIIYIYIKKNYN